MLLHRRLLVAVVIVDVRASGSGTVDTAVVQVSLVKGVLRADEHRLLPLANKDLPQNVHHDLQGKVVGNTKLLSRHGHFGRPDTLGFRARVAQDTSARRGFGHARGLL